MKQLLFLLLFPCFALAQYQGNANQKITLGEQTTADGLVFRGLRADTTSKIVPFSDTSAYIILDTVEKTLWLYKAGQVPKWQQVGGSAGGGGGVDSTAIAYVNTYGTQTVNGAKTFTTAPTFSTALLGSSGGTGITTFGAQHRIPYAASTTALTTSSALTFDASLGRLTVNGINTAAGSSSFVVNNSTPLELFKIQNTGTITVRGIGNISYNGFSAGENRYNLYSGGSTNNPLTFYVNGGARGSAYGEFTLNGDFDSNAFQGGGFYFDTRGFAPVAIVTKNNNANPSRVARFFGNGTMNIGAINDDIPTALLALAAGTSSKAPLRFTSGTNISTPEAGTVEFNGTNLFFTPSTTRHTVNHGLTGSATLDFPSTTTLLSSDLTISVTGAADGDVVSLGVPNAAVNENTCYTAWVSAANTVTVRFNNYSSGTVNPASGSFKVFVTK